jgi:phosphoribosylformylglycinamidine synthase subunit PurL
LLAYRIYLSNDYVNRALLQPTTVETAQKLGLLPEEFDKICANLGRVPNFNELSVYSVMWSEHCSYKNSITLLKTLPREGERVLAAAGEENAGMLALDGDLAVVFKIESHNHPSAIEPYQGAATGVGGIHRDIFTMGARPIAALNSLRFGNLDDPRTKHLLRGVVKGIGDYGNAFGVPTVGGEVYFDPCYLVNPLVNAMSVGIVHKDKVVSATALGVGNPVFIVGSATGKDGIHGATFASTDITESSSEKLPAVQVGDPFTEKKLLEASLEAIETQAIVGMQDMGAAGITCSSSEMSAKGEVGMDIWLDKVPLRQAFMEPFEILLSESQERMLIVVHKGQEDKIQAVFDKWDLPCIQIGVVTDTLNIRYYWGSELIGEVPADSLVLGGGAPIYKRDIKTPSYMAEVEAFDPNAIPEADPVEVTKFLLTQPSIASKRWVRRQYDSMVGGATMSTNRPSDAAVVHVKGTDMGLALSVDCNARYVRANPRVGAAMAVAEGVRNIACAGGKAIGITNCLNFGNPYNPEVYWQFAGAIEGMGEACRAFGLPVTGGNVSFYNQSTSDGPVFPTPTIGMVGVIDRVAERCMTLDFKAEGDALYLLGPITNDFACSEYVYSYHRVADSPAPFLDLNHERKLQAVLLDLIAKGLLQSAHDVSDGGLVISLLESAFPRGLGFDITSAPDGIRNDAYLFGEGAGRVLISTKRENAASLETHVSTAGLTLFKLGHVTGREAIVGGNSYGNVTDLAALYDTALETELAR